MAPLTIKPAEEKRLKGMGFLSNKGTDNFSARVLTVNGKITASQLSCVAEAAKRYGNGNVTFTTRLSIEVQGIPYENVEKFQEFIAQEGLMTGGTGDKIRPVVSCKGTTCQYGLIDTFGLSEEIHKRFFLGMGDVALPHKFKIAVGGCPNNCMKPDLNDVGIIGQRVPVLDEELCRGCKKCTCENVCPVHAAKLEDGKCRVDASKCFHCGRCVAKCPFKAMKSQLDGYKIYIGGRWGKQVARGRALSKIFTSQEEVFEILEKLILFYKENGLPKERFAQTIDRIGFENVEQLLGIAS